MATKYQSQINSALRLIQAKGMPLTVCKTTGGGIDPVTQVDTRTYTSYVGTGVQLPVGNIGKESSSVDKTSATKRKATKFLVAAKSLPVRPEAGDELSILDSLWEIMSVDTLAPDGTPIIFTIIVVQ